MMIIDKLEDIFVLISVIKHNQVWDQRELKKYVLWQDVSHPMISGDAVIAQ